MMMTDDQLTPTNDQVPAPENDAEATTAEEAPVVAEAPTTVSEEPAKPVEEPEPVEAATPAPVPVAEPPAAPVVSEPVTVQDDGDLFEAAMAQLDSANDQEGYKPIARGDRIEATVIQVEKDRVFVDLGTKSEGVIPREELSDLSIETAEGHVQVGDKIQVVVLRTGRERSRDEKEPGIVVSKKRADFEDRWTEIEQRFERNEMITAPVVDRVKGGLVVDIGVRGFVPATHVGSGKLRNIEKYVGGTLQLKIIEIDRERKKVVLSNREAEEQARLKAKEELFTKVAPGDILDGTVRRLTDYGAFIDLGGVDGLLHISEMSWMRIQHPREILKEGQDIKVMVLRLDASNGKISLGHRQVLPDPWTLIRQNYTSGQKMTCKISRLVVAGAFVKLAEGAEAFMPISEMSQRRIRHPNEVLEEGQEVEAQIIDLRPEERRMVLSIRAVGGLEPVRSGGDQPASYEDDFGKKGPKKGGKKGKGGRSRDDEEFEEIVGRRGFATGGATIGERLGMLKGLLRPDDDDADEEPMIEPESAEAPQPTEATEAAVAEVAPEVETPAEEAPSS